jgi:tyrosyl-tRNA synthetase
MTAKKRLAAEIVAIYHGESQAQKAAAEWHERHSEQKIPTDISEFKITDDLFVSDTIREIKLAPLLTAAGFTPTNSEAKRLISQGGVQLDGQKASPTDSGGIAIMDGQVLSVGRRRFIRLRL